MRRFIAAVVLATFSQLAWPWGQEGHSITAEIAQRRLTPKARATVEHLLGAGASLASIASWADDVREERPATYNWHFVGIPAGEPSYDPRAHCAPDQERGDCIVAELERLRAELRCAADDARRKEALMFAVHFVGDIHQPLHAIGDEKGGNLVTVDVEIHELKCTRADCELAKVRRNLHAVWDTTWITSTTWNWGRYVVRLEQGWLQSTEAQVKGIDGGTPAEWAQETHALGQTAWQDVPPDFRLTDDHYRRSITMVDRQLALGGLRLARLLNEAYASATCPR